MHDRNKSEKRTMVNERNKKLSCEPESKTETIRWSESLYKKQRKGMKKMNIIRKVFRYLFQPIEVEVRFPLLAWLLLILAAFIWTISKVEIICQ